MQVEKLHELLELKWNKLGNSQRVGLSDLQKDEILNTAIRDYFEYYGHGRNPKGLNLGFEAIQQRTDMLNSLLKPEIELIPTGSGSNWRVTKPSDYGTYSTMRAKEVSCSDRIKVTIEQHGDQELVLRDYHRKPNKKWGEAVGFEENSTFLVVTDNQVLDKVYLTYYKQPDEVSLGTYEDIPTFDNPNPGIRLHSDTDLPDKYIDVVIDIAIQNLSLIYERQIQYTLSKDRQQIMT